MLKSPKLIIKGGLCYGFAMVIAIKLQLGVTAPRLSSHQRGVVGHTEVLNMSSSPMSSPMVTFTDVDKLATASPHSPLYVC